MVAIDSTTFSASEKAAFRAMDDATLVRHMEAWIGLIISMGLTDIDEAQITMLARDAAGTLRAVLRQDDPSYVPPAAQDTYRAALLACGHHIARHPQESWQIAQGMAVAHPGLAPCQHAWLENRDMPVVYDVLRGTIMRLADYYVMALIDPHAVRRAGGM